METVVERIRRIGRESASPVEASPATQQAIASPPEQSITPSQPDEREQAIVDRHPSGWIVLSDNDYDYFSNEAEEMMKRNMERVSHPSVRGPIEVYRWGNK